MIFFLLLLFRLFFLLLLLIIIIIIMADLLVDNRAPRSMCVRWREQATSHLLRLPGVGVAAALRC